MYVDVDKISFAYETRPSGGLKPEPAWILKDYSLALERGDILGLAGPSGQGKSTLLRLIAGLERPQGGRIAIDGGLLSSERIFVPPEARGVGMVFQDLGLFPHLTVAGNVAYGLFRLSRRMRRDRVQAMLEMARMPELKDRHPYQLSGGQQQRVAIARALAPQPKVLLLDEPFSGLDAHLKSGLRAELRELLIKTATTAIVVSHDLADLEDVCGSIQVIDQNTAKGES